MKKSFNLNILIFVLFSIIFRVLLEISYVGIISQNFNYQGFKLNYSLLNYIMSWLMTLFGFLIVKDRINKVSDYFFITAFLAVIIPLSVLYGYDYERSIFPLIITKSALLFVYFITKTKFLSFKGIQTIKNGRKISIVICTTFVLFLVVWYKIKGVTYNLDFSKVYEFRRDNKDLASAGLLAYTNNWTYKIFNIFLFSFSLYRRRYFLALLVFILQVYFYAAAAHKVLLFLPFMVLGIWFYFKKTNSLIVVPFIFSMAILISIVTFYVFNDTLTSFLFSRRVFFVPAHLTFVYFEYFSQNAHVFWSNSILSQFITYPYDVSMTHVIGRYLGNEDSGANNGFIASGFAHAGLLGVLFYSFIVGLILRLINDITLDAFPLWLAVSLCVVPLRSLLISSDLFTTMLTHGFLVALIIIFLVRLPQNCMKYIR
jgi:hypothetical protein